MRLVLRRAALARTLLAAAAITATVTTALLTAFLQFAQLLPAAGGRAAVAGAPVSERTLFVTMSAGDNAQDLEERDAAVRKLFTGGLGGVPVTVDGGAYAISQRLADGRSAVVAYLDRLAEHADLVDGAWPVPVPRGQPVQAAVPEAVAAALGVRVGGRIAVNDDRTKKPAPLAVVGVYRPRDAGGGYWRLAAAPVAAGGLGPLAVDRAEFLARYQLLSTVNWVAIPAADQLAGRRLEAVSAQATRLRTTEAQKLGLDTSTKVSTGLDELAGRLRVAELVTRSGLLLPALLLTLIAGYTLWLVARLLNDQRRGEHSLLRARGAARGQLARLATGEALLVIVPAGLLGAPLAAAALRAADRRLTTRGLALSTVDIPMLGAWQGWAIAVAAALCCAVALVLPAARRGRTWVAEQQERSRPTRWAVAQRAGVDLALVVLAVLAWSQLRQYGGPLTGPAGALGIDPLLVTAPAIGVLATTAVSLRLLPAATRGGVRVAERRRSFASLLGVWQADRRPHAGPVLLLVLAVAVAALAGCVAATWQLSQRDQAAHEAGADLRISRATASVPAPAVADLAALPGVATVMRADRGTLQVSNEATATLLAVETTKAAQVMRIRPDLAEPGLFDRMPAPRRLSGTALPAQTRRLTGQLLFAVSGTGTAQAFSTDVAVYLDDGSGLLQRVSLGTPLANRALPFDVPVPAGSTLVGLASSGRLEFDPFNEAEGGFEGTVAWTISRLAAVDAQGARTEVTAPTTWELDTTADQFLHLGEAKVTGLDVRYTVSIDAFMTNAWTFRLADVASAREPVPALVTPAVLAGTSKKVGDRVELGSSGGTAPLEIKIVGVLDALPSAPGAGGVVVDLPTYAGYRFAHEQLAASAAEWWLATRAGEHDRAAAAVAGQSGLAVVDREALTRRLLDDPLGIGVLLALYAAALAATVLAGFGLAVDARSTALRRSGEMAVLHTLGASPNALARALVVEQALLAGLGVLSGLLVGIAVAAAMAPALVLTAAARAPVPPALLVVPPTETGLPALALLLVALLLGAVVARRTRREVVTGLLRMGTEQ